MKVEREKAKKGMKAFRARQTYTDKELEQFEAWERMEKHRTEKSVEDCDFDKNVKKQRLREARQKQSVKEHLMRNLKAKKGIQLVNQEGTLRQFSRRERLMTKFHTKDDLIEWKNYWQRSGNPRQKLQNTKPDMVKRINEQIRLDKESRSNEEESGF